MTLLDLTPTELALTLAVAGRGMRHEDVTDALEMSAGAAAALVRRLEREAVVELEPDPFGTRLRLTPAAAMELEAAALRDRAAGNPPRGGAVRRHASQPGDMRPARTGAPRRGP